MSCFCSPCDWSTSRRWLQSTTCRITVFLRFSSRASLPPEEWNRFASRNSTTLWHNNRVECKRCRKIIKMKSYYMWCIIQCNSEWKIVKIILLFWDIYFEKWEVLVSLTLSLFSLFYCYVLLLFHLICFQGFSCRSRLYIVSLSL